MTTSPVVLNETITRDPNYTGHWRGEAFITHHTYGDQVHRTRDDAERWNATQRDLRPAGKPVPADVERITDVVSTFLRIDVLDRARLVVTARPTDDGYPTPGAYTIAYAAAGDFWPVRFVNAVESMSAVADAMPTGWSIEAYGEHALCVTPEGDAEHVNDPARALATIRGMFSPPTRGWLSTGYADVHTITVPAAITVTHADGTADTVQPGHYVLTVDAATGAPIAAQYGTARAARDAAAHLAE